MKTSKSIAVYFIVFFTMYFVIGAFLSIFYPEGAAHNSYVNCIKDGAWFTIYTMFIGWWVALIPAIEYYEMVRKGE